MVYGSNVALELVLKVGRSVSGFQTEILVLVDPAFRTLCSSGSLYLFNQNVGSRRS